MFYARCGRTQTNHGSTRKKSFLFAHWNEWQTIHNLNYILLVYSGVLGDDPMSITFVAILSCLAKIVFQSSLVYMTLETNLIFHLL